MQDQGLDWGKCVVVCIDGAACMVGCDSDVRVKIRKVANKSMLSCTLHNSSKKFSCPEIVT